MAQTYTHWLAHSPDDVLSRLEHLRTRKPGAVRRRGELQYEAMTPVGHASCRLLGELVGYADRHYTGFGLRTDGMLGTVFTPDDLAQVTQRLDEAGIAYRASPTSNGRKEKLVIDPAQENFFSKLTDAVAGLRLARDYSHIGAYTGRTVRQRLERDAARELWRGLSLGQTR